MDLGKYLADLAKAAIPLLKNPVIVRWASGFKFTYPSHKQTVDEGKFDAEGTFQRLFGMDVGIFRIEEDKHWWHGRVRIDKIHKTWSKDIEIPNISGHQCSLALVAISPDLKMLVNYYSQMHVYVKEKCDQPNEWPPIVIHPDYELPGLLELDRVLVTVK